MFACNGNIAKRDKMHFICRCFGFVWKRREKKLKFYIIINILESAENGIYWRNLKRLHGIHIQWPGLALNQTPKKHLFFIFHFYIISLLSIFEAFFHTCVYKCDVRDHRDEEKSRSFLHFATNYISMAHQNLQHQRRVSAFILFFVL